VRLQFWRHGTLGPQEEKRQFFQPRHPGCGQHLRPPVPRQRQSLEVARSGYLSGQIDFFNLTDAEQTLLRFGLAGGTL